MKNAEPYFAVDPAFKGSSYAKRYETLCQRLVYERIYDAACLTLSTNADPTRVTHPSPYLDFQQFAAKLQGHAQGFARSYRGS